MHYGVVMFATEYAMAPDELARALEERGFESIWYPEHTHIPASRISPWPGGPDLPREDWSGYDPFLAHALATPARAHPGYESNLGPTRGRRRPGDLRAAL